MLERETVTGKSHEDKLAEMKAQRVEVQGELKSLEAQWEKEKELVAKIRDLRDRLEGRPPVPSRRSRARLPSRRKPRGAQPRQPRPARLPLPPHRRRVVGKTAGAHAGRTRKTPRRTGRGRRPN